MRIPRLGCLGWVMAGILFIAAVGLVGYLWYHSTADIRQVEQEARAIGIPPTWAEAGVIQADPATLATCTALVALADSTRSWTSDHSQDLPRIGEEPPASLREYHATIALQVWDDLSDKITALSAKPVVLHAQPQEYYRKSNSYWSELRDLSRLFTEQLLIVPLTEVPAVVLAASHIAVLVSPQALIDQLVNDSMAQIVVQGVTRRLPELRQTPAGNACAQHLRVLRDTLWNSRAQVWISQLMMGNELSPGAFGTVSFPVTYEWEELWGKTQENSKIILRPLAWRAQRADSMRVVVQYAHAYQMAKDPADLTRQIALVVIPPSLAMQWAAALDCDSGIENLPLIDRAFLKAILSLDVVIAELAGSALPADYFSPTQAPLKPVIRSGKRIGWYSVDANGVDDGGLRKNDFGIPTDETFGKRHFTDELESRVMPPATQVVSSP